ncbi:HK97 gp10 family phage protein [Clostridium pasteurianum]|uniref:Phage protein, HK97 gp10 family n=1 Tax=Clostridium pasteurianum BC1 TaxID=86416 RepID=R4K6J0_CLOPA|nr:HK97 gp10 family phage protein [Clostridium pasteurianum]AGK98168.1 hypothetical protein Clopa_3372 [Clostridium pasteurianum BC1]
MSDTEWTQIEGLAELEKNFDKALKEMGVINNKAFTDITLDLLGKSVKEAPVDLGDLRGSGSATINGTTVATGNKEGGINPGGNAQDEEIMQGTVGFSEPYAVKQHEHLEYQHPKGGKAKYLEDPFKANSQNYIDHIAQANRDHLG